MPLSTTAAQESTWARWIQIPLSWTNSSTTSTITFDNTWNQWVTTGTSTSTGYLGTRQDGVWIDWQAMNHEHLYTYQPTGWREPTQAELDAAQARREEASRKALAEKQRMEGAQDRAMELLLMLLTPEERVHHDLHDEIKVRGQSGRLYLIKKHGVHGNIIETDEHGCVLGKVCVQPHMWDEQANLAMPLADGWVGQYLGLKHDEEHLRATGNWSGRRPCQQPNVPILRAA